MISELVLKCRKASKNCKIAVETRQEYSNRSEGFIDNWQNHFLCLLIMFGCGQRPQVFTLLKSMTKEDLKAFHKKTVKEEHALEIRIRTEEKTFRAIAVPYLMLPPKLAKLLPIHIKVVQPILYKNFGIEKGDERRKFLFLHPTTGEVLESSQVTSCLKSFLPSEDPTLEFLSVMTIKSSFCSIMLKRYIDGEEFNYIELNDFIVYLAKVMNTFPEQIRRTYATIQNDEPFRRVVCRVLRIIKK